MSTIRKKTDEVRPKGGRALTTQAAMMGLGKLPPQAVDLEEAVLGALMLEKDALTSVIDILRPEIFYVDAHQQIFKAIYNLFQQSKPVDILTVTAELKKLGTLDIVGGPYYITRLTNRVASSAHVEFHSRIVIQKFIQRELIRISSETMKDAYEDTSDVFGLLDKVEQGLFDITQGNTRKNYEEMVDLVKRARENIEAAANKQGNEAGITGVPSGFIDLDRVTAGWQASDLIVVAARPGVGKTAFVLSMARNIATKFKRPIAFFSLEMSAIQLVNRLIASETGLNAENLTRGKLAPHEWQQLSTKIRNLENAPIYIDDTPALSVFELRAKCRRLKSQKDIQIIVVDYLQLMQGSAENKNSNREQEISHISRSLKSIAKELNVPVIALSQLSRRTETRGGNMKPILSDLRESGAIEQDADIVLFLYRAEMHGKPEDDDGNSTDGIAEVLIAKHRNGALKDVKMKFIKHLAKFEDLDYSESVDLSDVPLKDFTSPNTITRSSRMNSDDEQGAPF